MGSDVYNKSPTPWTGTVVVNALLRSRPGTQPTLGLLPSSLFSASQDPFPASRPILSLSSVFLKPLGASPAEKGGRLVTSYRLGGGGWEDFEENLVCLTEQSYTDVWGLGHYISSSPGSQNT